MDLEFDPAELYEKMGKVSFENAVRTDELPLYIQSALKKPPKKPRNF